LRKKGKEKRGGCEGVYASTEYFKKEQSIGGGGAKEREKKKEKKKKKEGPDSRCLGRENSSIPYRGSAEAYLRAAGEKKKKKGKRKGGKRPLNK